MHVKKPFIGYYERRIYVDDHEFMVVVMNCKNINNRKVVMLQICNFEILQLPWTIFDGLKKLMLCQCQNK